MILPNLGTIISKQTTFETTLRCYTLAAKSILNINNLNSGEKTWETFKYYYTDITLK